MSTAQDAANPLEGASQAVLAKSSQLPSGTPSIRGHDFDGPSELDDVMRSMLTTGLQATALGQAVDEVNRMLRWRLWTGGEAGAGAGDEEGGASWSGPSPPGLDLSTLTDAERAEAEAGRAPVPQEAAAPGPRPAPRDAHAARRAKIFLGYTSNLISAGVREHILYLVKHGLVDVLVTTAGGVEEDFVKCLGDTYVGDFALPGAELRAKGLNRIGNMLVPNDNYCAFEDWLMPILDACLAEQRAGRAPWTPSDLIRRLGLEIGNGAAPHPERSVYYWAARNGIPVYCPAITDGSLGDMLYFHSYKSPGLVVDVVADIRAMNDEALKAAPRKTGIIILGGGVPKHHICNANLMRNGADFAVFLNTAQEYDGSDSGARPDEAISWGKIRADAKPVKVHGDASILFPLLISQTFVKEHGRRVERGEL